MWEQPWAVREKRFPFRSPGTAEVPDIYPWMETWRMFLARMALQSHLIQLS